MKVHKVSSVCVKEYLAFTVCESASQVFYRDMCTCILTLLCVNANLVFSVCDSVS